MIAAMWGVSLIILALLAVSAVFSAAETALTRASRGRMHQLERDGDKGAGRVNRLLSDQETMIGAVLIGYNVINILSSALATEFITRVLPGGWGRGAGHRDHDRAGGGVRRGAAPRPWPSSAPTRWPAPSRRPCWSWCAFSAR